MSTEYKPGTVAIATVRGVEGVRVMRSRAGWMLDRRVDGGYPGTYSDYAALADVTDVRPLVVLDLDGHDRDRAVQCIQFVKKAHAGTDHGDLVSLIADQIEAQTKPQRIPEPGEGGVVEASCVHNDHRLRWVRVRENWHAIPGVSSPDDWDSLIDPTLIRDGVN